MIPGEAHQVDDVAQQPDEGEDAQGAIHRRHSSWGMQATWQARGTVAPAASIAREHRPDKRHQLVPCGAARAVKAARVLGLAWLAEGGSRGAIYCTRTAPTLDSDDFRRGGSDHLEQLIEVKRLLQDGHRQH